MEPTDWLLLAWLPWMLSVSALDISQCIAPLGVESGQIPDRALTASSSFNDGNVGPQNARLNQEIKGGAWCPASQITTERTEWLEVDLGAVHVVTAAGIQGRFGNGQGREYAEAYVVEYWRPKLAKWVRYRTADGNEILPGNTNTYLERKSQLEPAVWAQKVRFIPHSAHRRTVCLRVELYGCLWTEGIVSYTIPRGDKRSNGVELSDAAYDGTWSGDELRHGLGQLVDGRYGGDEIREAARASAWVGWRNDSRAAPHLTFEFDRVREFSALHLYCNNRFMRDVQVFSEAIISFSVGGRQFQPEPVRFSPEPDHIFESSRNVSIQLHHRIGKWVRIQLKYAARWILISEVVFDSDVAQGNYTSEVLKPSSGKDKSRVTVPGVGGAVSGAGGVSVGGARGAGDPVFVAVGVGVLTALAILLGVAVLLLLHRHRHRKCFASPLAKPLSSAPHGDAPPPPAPLTTLDSYSRCGTSVLQDHKLDLKSDDYQEPYQPLKCAPYFTYSTVLLEMKDFITDSNTALSDSSNYEYAVPELSSAPLLSRRRPASPASSRSHHDSPTHTAHSNRCVSASGSTGRHEVVSELKRRLQSTSVAEFPRHRLRMISKLAEGAFGTVYVAEADGVPGYDGAVTPDKRLVAVKFMCHDATPTEREQFERDVRILAAFSCPQLSRVVGACRSPPLAVVLEYLPRGDLSAVLRAADAPPPLRTLLHVAEQVAAGMRYLESLNFVHRDLAARNILVGENFEIKISDFGTDNEAYSRDYYRVEGRIPLPLRWAAWESALLGRYTTKSDVWAFAVTLYEVFTLCRRRPHDALTDRQLLLRLARLETDSDANAGLPCEPRPPLAPRDVYDAMLECWRRDEADRPTFADLHLFLQRKCLALDDS